MTGNQPEALVTIRGIVIPMTWTEDGTVTGVAISGFDEQDFSVSSSCDLRQWLSLLRKEVEVVGVVAETESGPKVIKVCNFRVIREEERDEAG